MNQRVCLKAKQEKVWAPFLVNRDTNSADSINLKQHDVHGQGSMLVFISTLQEYISITAKAQPRWIRKPSGIDPRPIAVWVALMPLSLPVAIDYRFL